MFSDLHWLIAKHIDFSWSLHQRIDPVNQSGLSVCRLARKDEPSRNEEKPEDQDVAYSLPSF